MSAIPSLPGGGAAASPGPGGGEGHRGGARGGAGGCWGDIANAASLDGRGVGPLRGGATAHKAMAVRLVMVLNPMPRSIQVSRPTLATDPGSAPAHWPSKSTDSSPWRTLPAAAPTVALEPAALSTPTAEMVKVCVPAASVWLVENDQF